MLNFSVQVFAIDYYLYRVHGETKPIIRIFSCSNNAQRCCLHIHEVFPYLYFRPDDVNEPSFDDPFVVQRYCAYSTLFCNNSL